MAPLLSTTSCNHNYTFVFLFGLRKGTELGHLQMYVKLLITQNPMNLVWPTLPTWWAWKDPQVQTSWRRHHVGYHENPFRTAMCGADSVFPSCYHSRVILPQTSPFLRLFSPPLLQRFTGTLGRKDRFSWSYLLLISTLDSYSSSQQQIHNEGTEEANLLTWSHGSHMGSVYHTTPFMSH